MSTASSTAAERDARAAEWEAQYEALTQSEGSLSAVEQACEDALTDMTSGPVLRVRAAIRRVALSDNPDEIMQQWARTWLKSTDGLIAQAETMLQAKAARVAVGPGPDDPAASEPRAE